MHGTMLAFSIRIYVFLMNIIIIKNKQFKFINSYYFVNLIFLSEIIYDVFLKRTSDNIQCPNLMNLSRVLNPPKTGFN